MGIILHCDMNNYFVSVELVDKPQLSALPVAVCGDPAQRHGIVLAKNYEAKKFGVVTGESIFEAKKKCSSLVVIKPDYHKYLKYTKQARDIFSRYTDKIYPYGMDEAWLDLGHIPLDKGVETADELRSVIKDELKITASVGVSFNYVFSKLASDMKKPDATTVLPRDQLENTIWKRPAFEMLFVGAATRRALRKMGVLTIGDIAAADPNRLEKILGKKGRMLWEFSNGNDSGFNPCTNNESDIKSLGNTITPPKDITDKNDIAAFIYVLCQTVERRLNKHNFLAGGVSIVIRSDDFSQLTRSVKLPTPTNNPDLIFYYAYNLFSSNYTWDKNVRSIGVKAERISSANIVQTLLFPEELPDNGNIKQILDTVKEKYGNFCHEITATSKDIEILPN
ncbi:MAG: DNA polymerase IV [Clostridiales bacterium]|nr:MAG: DNA polymerase IV [Clostridiales bacterium]